MDISTRRPLNSVGKATNWARTVNGRTFWFEAAPYRVRVWRLTLKGGDLVHDWRAVPDTVGEYDSFDPASAPQVGEIAWSRHWDRDTADRLYFTRCRACLKVVEITDAQTVTLHSMGTYDAGRNCDGSGVSATLRAALVRDDALNSEEARVSSTVSDWCLSCTGFDSITGERCHHPICSVRRDAGLTWSLMGWRRNGELVRSA
ncbi:hypothetical protein [Streptomyces sp. CAU 1734]|uniref:hypothetical protein n=1 Tax=Streptomyces sp. CAU 1734 TaxID=3140360 RepID=UPI003261BC42